MSPVSTITDEQLMVNIKFFFYHIIIHSTGTRLCEQDRNRDNEAYCFTNE